MRMVKLTQRAGWPETAVSSRIIWWGIAVACGLLAARLPWQRSGLALLQAAVVLGILIRPSFGLALTLLLGPFGALENVISGGSLLFGLPFLDSGQILLALTLAAVAAQRLRQRRLTLPSFWLAPPLGLLLLVTAVSLLGAPSLSEGVQEWLKWVQMGLMLWLVLDRIQPDENGRSQLWWLVGVLLLSGLLQAGIGVWQFGLRGDGPEHFIILGGYYRAYGTFEQPNPFGGFMHMTGLLAAGIALSWLGAWLRRWRFRDSPPMMGSAARRWLLGMGWATAVLTTLALVFSWSRGAWLSFGVGAAVLALFWPRRRALGVGLLLVGAAALLVGIQTGLAPASVTNRLVSFGDDLRFGDVRGVDINDANYAVLERLAHWQAAVDMARSDVWLGIGFGNYEPAYDQFALINWPDALGHAHNYYLNLLAETGVLGLAAYAIFWTAVLWQTLRLLRADDWLVRGVALGSLAVWAALAMHHLVDKLYVNNLYLHLGAMFGVLQVMQEQRRTMRG